MDWILLQHRSVVSAQDASGRASMCVKELVWLCGLKYTAQELSSRVGVCANMPSKSHHRNDVIKRYHNITVVPTIVCLCLCCGHNTQVVHRLGRALLSLAGSPGWCSSPTQYFTVCIEAALLDFEPTYLFCQHLKALTLDRVVQ